MTMDWFIEWLIHTTVCCTLPVWIILSAWVDIPYFTAHVWGPAGAYQSESAWVLCWMVVLVFWFWIIMSLAAYGCLTLEGGFKGGNGDDYVYAVIAIIIGSAIGMGATATYAPRIDAYFGVRNGFSVITSMYTAVGTAYIAVKTVKLGGAIIRKI